MAIDPQIALSFKAPEIASPVQNIGALMAIRGQMSDIALRQAQADAARQNAADVAEQVQTRQRANDAQRRLTDILQQPGAHDKIQRGHLSPITDAGIPIEAAAPVVKNLQDIYQKTLDLDKTTAERHLAGRTAFGKGLTDIDPKDPAAADQLNSLKLTLGQDYPDLARQIPTFIAGPNLGKQIEDEAKKNGVFTAILDAHVARAKTQSEVDQANAAAAASQANAEKTTQMLPGELAAQATKNEQDARALAGTSAAGVSAEEQARETETKRHNQRQEAVAAGELAVKQKQFEATLGSGLDVNGTPLPPEAAKAAALQDPTAQAIAHYQIAPPPTATRGGIPSPILRKVLAINPNYDGTQFPARNKVQQDFSAAGASGKLITSADTALAHLDAISKAGAALNNGDVQQLNRLANAVGAQLGQTPKQTYDTIISMVSPEISKAVIGEAGGESERANMQKNFSSNASTAQRESAIAAAAGLLSARIHKQAQAYESSIGTPLDLSKRLSPESQAVMQKYGSGGSPAVKSGSAPKTADEYLKSIGH